MKIAICDDEKVETSNLRALINEFAREKHLDLVCTEFNSTATLISAEKFDLYFLDYMMDERNGVDVAKALQEKFNNTVTICFLTNYDSAASEVINNQVYADGFLRKPVDVEKLREKLDAFYRMSGLRRFELRKGKSFRTVYAEDIMFIEADGKRSTIHFADHCESFNYLISELETIFEPSRCFCRIHRSFIVNLQFVKEYDGKYVILKNGTDLPLKSRGFKAAYADYILNH